jgi:arsenate reductase (thioredoxin)
MAEGFLKSFNPSLRVFSAGTAPATRVNPLATKVMKEIGIDIGGNKPKNVEEFLNDSFDYVITVCDNAKETCPVFIGKVHHRMHIGFEDPAEAAGSQEEVLSVFRSVRDEIRKAFTTLYEQELSNVS